MPKQYWNCKQCKEKLICVCAGSVYFTLCYKLNMYGRKKNMIMFRKKSDFVVTIYFSYRARNSYKFNTCKSEMKNASSLQNAKYMYGHFRGHAVPINFRERRISFTFTERKRISLRERIINVYQLLNNLRWAQSLVF